MDGDFKRPLGNNNTGVAPTPQTGGYEGSPETYENAEGSPVEVTKEPQVVQEKKPGKAKKVLKWLFMTVLLLGLAGAAGWFWYDGQGAKDELSSVKAELAKAKADVSSAKSELNKQVAAKPAELTTKEKIQLAASNYACSVVIASTNTCDKASQTVVRMQEQSSSQAGFAIVNIVDTSNKVIMHLLEKSVDGKSWTVIFKGDKLDTATIDAFKVPTAYTDLTVSS